MSASETTGLGTIALLLPDAGFDRQAFVDWLRSMGLDEIIPQMLVTDQAIVFASPGAVIAALTIPEPLSGTLIDEALARSHWFAGKAGLPRHRGQLAFAAMKTPEDTAGKVALAGTMTVLATLASKHLGAIAVYNGGVGTLIDVDALDSQMGIAGRGQLPLLLWTYTAPHSMTDGDVSLSTGGLAPFLGFEVEVWHAPGPLAEVKTMMDGVIHYLLQNGPVIGDGDTLGATADDRQLRAVFGPSRADRNAPTSAMMLEWS